MEKYINSQHRYYTLDYYLKERFKDKVFKVALNGNFTCPNRDGKISKTGCIFCSASGSGDFGGNKADSLDTQFNIIKGIIHEKWPKAKYIAYFQANTNTYGPIEKLRKIYYEAINLNKDIVALSIATRPDCLSEEILDLLEEINQHLPVWVELGLQTIHEKTAEFINRGYKLSIFEKAVRDLRKHHLEVIVHIINGLPYETKEMMIDTVKYLDHFDIQGIKIHSLFVLKNTPLAIIYQNNPFHVLTLDEYVDITSEQLAYLNKNIVVHRLNGDAPRDDLIAPLWSLKKLVVMNEIDKAMKNKDYYQGIKSENN